MSYEIVVDMSLDIDEDFYRSHPMKFVPMEYVVGEESRRCEGPESREMLHMYYEKLRKKVPTQTSQISPYHYIEAFEPLVKEKKPFLYLCLSGGLSSTFASAETALNTLREDYGEVEAELVDTFGATGGMGLLAEAAFHNMEQGMSLQENARWLRDHARKVNYWFKVEDLMYLMRGGRVSATSAVMGTALNIKPILILNGQGKLDTVAKKRGNKQAYRYMLEQLERDFDPSVTDVVYICCADCMEEAEKLKGSILEWNPALKVRITMLSPIIGAHTGPDMIAIIFFGKERV